MTIPDIQELQIGINNKFSFKKIQIKQYDKNTRQIDIYLLDSSGQIINIPSTFIAKFQATKKDKTIVFDNCTISDNKITYIAKESLTAVAGEVKCEIGLYEPDISGDTTKDKLIQSKTFYIDVEPSAMDRNAVESSDDFNALTIMINNITGISAEAEQAITNINTAITNSEVATEKANASVANVNEVIDTMNQKITESEQATQSAIAATDGVNAAISNAEQATQNAIAVTNEVNAATQNAVVATNDANTATQKANTATLNANTATQNANTVTDKLNKETLIIWKTVVETYNDIFTTYPNPELGWTTTAKDTGFRWRYNGTQWINIGLDANSGIDISMIGNLEDLVTNDKSNIVGSINETNTKIETSENNSKAYTDQQIALVTETGIPKLNVYEYKFYDQPIGTTTIQIPLETFDKKTDKVKLFINSVQRDSDFYTLNDTGLITLNDALVTESKTIVEVWKNIPLGESGSVSGAVLAIDSVPQDRIVGLSDLAAEVENLRIESEYANTTLSQDYKSIFNASTGKDSDGMEQDFNNIANGQSNVKLDGLTANNLAKNGDFNTTSGWNSTNATISSSNNILTATITALDWVGSYQIGINAKKGNKYYASVSVFPKYSDRFSIGLANDTFIANNIKANEWNRLSETRICTIENDLIVVYQDTKQSGQYIIGDTFKIKDMVLIDLTALGLDTLTKEQCDYMFEHYIDGIQGVGSGKLVSTGKNLLQNLDWRLGGYKNTNNIITIDTTSKNRVGTKIRISKNTTYTLKVPDGYQFQYVETDQNGYLLNTEYWISGSKTITTNSSSYYMFVFVRKNDEANFVSSDFPLSVQLEKGSETTQYEPYRSSELVTTLPYGMQLHRLSNGIADTIEEVNGTKYLTKRIKEIILNGTETYHLESNITNDNYVVFTLSNTTDLGENTNMLCDKFITTTDSTDKNHNGEGVIGGKSYNVIYIKIAKSKLATVDVTGFKAWLQSNPTKIIYQLAQPIVYKNGENGFSQVGNLEVYPNGTIYQEPINPKQSANAKTYINYNLSTKAVIMSNSAEITGLAKNAIDKSMIVQNALSTNPDTVASGVALKNVQDQVNMIINKLAWSSPIQATLKNGWQGALYFSKNGLGDVWIRGNIKPGILDFGTAIAEQLPADYRSQYPYQITINGWLDSGYFQSGLTYASDGYIIVYLPLAGTAVTQWIKINQVIKIA